MLKKDKKLKQKKRKQNKKRKAQIKNFENIIVLVIVTFLIVMGFVFYSKFSKQDIRLEGEKQAALDAIKIAEIVKYLPEVRCSEENIPTAGCFDLAKLNAVTDFIENDKRYYLSLLSMSRIVVTELYPDTNEYIVYDRAPEGDFSYLPTHIPITIYDATVDRHYYGVLEVGLYEKER